MIIRNCISQEHIQSGVLLCDIASLITMKPVVPTLRKPKTTDVARSNIQKVC